MEHSEDIHVNWELVTVGGFDDPFQTWSSSRGNFFKCNHEEADTWLIAHAAEAVVKVFNKISVMSQDTDVLLEQPHTLVCGCSYILPL